MPCRDDNSCDEDDRWILELQNRADQLTIELCQARKVLIDIEQWYVDQRSDPIPWFPADLYRALQEQRNLHRTHREYDKNRALAEYKLKKVELSARIDKIEKLGGMPKPALKDEHDEIVQTLIDIEKSDPLNTKLY